MSNIIQKILDKIKDNEDRAITGSVLQDVLIDMVNRDVFLSESQYNELILSGTVDEDKIYHVYEDEESSGSGSGE